MVRHVLRLPEMEDETNYRVELIVGKLVTTDARKRFFFGGKIEAVIIEGFGFTRFVRAELGQMAGTLMAVDPDEPKVTRFISLGGEPQILLYNSLLPLVVYVPEGVEVRYGIWSATPEANTMEKG